MAKFRYVKGYEGRYEVSEAGLVRNSVTGRVLIPAKFSNGYMGVYLGRGKQHLVHRLVAAAWVGGDATLQINHKNGVRDDNRAENLEWLSCGDNHRHSYASLNRKPHALIRRVAVSFFGNDIRKFDSVKHAAKALGVAPGSVASAALHNHRCAGAEVRYG